MTQLKTQSPFDRIITNSTHFSEYPMNKTLEKTLVFFYIKVAYRYSVAHMYWSIHY